MKKITKIPATSKIKMCVFKNIICFIALLFSLNTYSAQANEAYYRNFWYPKLKDRRLAYCTYSQNKCGMAVANDYCKIMGYKKAHREIIANNVGITNYLDRKAGCTGWKCNGFKLIQCERDTKHKPPAPYYYRYKRFVLPRFNDYRVDWCYEKGQHCGLRPAESFCRRMGYLKAKSYGKQNNLPATKELGDQALCFGGKCSGYKYITCFR